MIDSKIFDDITKKLCEAVPESFKTVQHDIERNFRAVLQTAFSKLDLVTREEFDVQAGVLAKTRTKLESMEKKLADLEAQLGTTTKGKAEKPKKATKG